MERKARETLKKYGYPTGRKGLQRRRVDLDNKEQIALNKELATILERQEIQESSDQEWSRVHAIRERMDKITKTAWESTPEQVKTVDALFIHLGRVKTDLMSGLWEDAVASMYGVGRCAALVGIEGFARTGQQVSEGGRRGAYYRGGDTPEKVRQRHEKWQADVNEARKKDRKKSWIFIATMVGAKHQVNRRTIQKYCFDTAGK